MKKIVFLLTLFLLSSPAFAQWQDSYYYTDGTYDYQIHIQMSQGCEYQNNFTHQADFQDQDSQFYFTEQDVEQFAQFLLLQSNQLTDWESSSWQSPQTHWDSSSNWNQAPANNARTQVPLRHTQPGGAGEFKATTEGFGQSRF